MKRSIYIHQKKAWPQLTWRTDDLLPVLTAVHKQQGRLLGKLERWQKAWKNEAQLAVLEVEIVQSSAVEGEHLPPAEVRSSLARRLGLKVAGLPEPDAKVEGVVEMMMDATRNFKATLCDELLFGWHSALFPTGRSGMHRIEVAQWRNNAIDDPLQVVSGAAGKEKVHFEAPLSALVPEMMRAFFHWFNEDNSLDPFLKAGLAHLWFLTIHPFDDGNGRIARALTEKLLCHADGHAWRFYSMSAQIKQRRKDYYLILEKTQQGSLNVTQWLQWFLKCLLASIEASEAQMSRLLQVAAFWEKHQQTVLSDRQLKVLKRLCGDFMGVLNNAKYATLAKCSSDTALRDLQDLVAKKVLRKQEGGGRSTAYEVLWPVA